MEDEELRKKEKRRNTIIIAIILLLLLIWAIVSLVGKAGKGDKNDQKSEDFLQNETESSLGINNGETLVDGENTGEKSSEELSSELTDESGNQGDGQNTTQNSGQSSTQKATQASGQPSTQKSTQGSTSSTTKATSAATQSSTQKATQGVTACAHTYYNYKRTKDPNYYETGILIKKCSKCGDTYEQELPVTSGGTLSVKVSGTIFYTQYGRCVPIDEYNWTKYVNATITGSERRESDGHFAPGSTYTVSFELKNYRGHDLTKWFTPPSTVTGQFDNFETAQSKTIYADFRSKYDANFHFMRGKTYADFMNKTFWYMDGTFNDGFPCRMELKIVKFGYNQERMIIYAFDDNGNRKVVFWKERPPEDTGNYDQKLGDNMDDYPNGLVVNIYELFPRE